MKKHAFSLSITIAVIVFGGCSSNPKLNFSLQQRRVTIITDPPGAIVTQINALDESLTSLGTTPLNDIPVIILRNVRSSKNFPVSETQRILSHVGNVVVKIEKPGYESSQHILRTEQGETIVHNITLQSLVQ